MWSWDGLQKFSNPNSCQKQGSSVESEQVAPGLVLKTPCLSWQHAPLHQERFRLGIRKKVFYSRGDGKLELVAQKGGGCPILEHTSAEQRGTVLCLDIPSVCLNTVPRTLLAVLASRACCRLVPSLCLSRLHVSSSRAIPVYVLAPCLGSALGFVCILLACSSSLSWLLWLIALISSVWARSSNHLFSHAAAHPLKL